ncbi:hypothetical protein BC941DRAFT_437037 [Chlamydoabsidia padenii]|nr:hypothetical protein BC941DRAFT_437037 [Chlamydoabsidia padenii]
MASLLWTKNQQHSKSHSRAPSSIFSNNSNLSPRQVANKAYSLAIKKLDRDDKRSRPHYNVRERLLLCNTLSRAEQFLQKRTTRTNRRVMAFEEDDVVGHSEDNRRNPPPAQPMEHHSPLCEATDDDDDDEEEEYQPTTPPPEEGQLATLKSLLPMGTNAFVIPQDDEDFLQYPSSFMIPTSDCRSFGHQSPIASII